MPTTTRREFLQHALATGAATALTGPRWAAASSPRPPFAYVDGLTFFSPDPADIDASGLSAFICDVSSAERLDSADGAVKYWRSFEACVKSMTATRRRLAAGELAGAFLATRGREIVEAHRAGRTAVFFQIQGGGEAVGEDLWRLETFHELGLRVFQITHHNDNAWGGGAIEREWSGLTKVGHEGVERLDALGMVADLSHVSEPTSLDVLRVSKRPVIVSHSAARAIVPNARCTPDSVIRGVAESGGAFGVFMMSFWLTTAAEPSVEAFVQQVRHVVKVGGIDAAAVANDYTVAGELNAAKVANDNAKAIVNYHAWWDAVGREGVMGFEARPSHVVIPELNNVRRMFLIHEALDRAGFTAGEVEKVMGGNWIRVLTDALG
ncbi:MAG: membrane dipeptidase [Acidobacteria bacterium]|nr:membrane dipeptidase [Acidobacteriota bacterium]